MRDCRASDILKERLRPNTSPVNFEEQITQLCQELIACKSEVKAVELARLVQSLMHTRIEDLRSNLVTLPPTGPTGIDKQTA